MIDNSKKICDVNQAISNMGNSPDLFIKHFNKFKNSGFDIINQLEELIRNDNFSDAFILCHSLKGLSGMLCFPSLHKHSEEAESLFKKIAAEQAGENSDEATDCSVSENGIKPNQQKVAISLYSSIVHDIEAICEFQPHL